MDLSPTGIITGFALTCESLHLDRPVMLEIDCQGELLKVKQVSLYAQDRLGASKRGTIRDFSQKSRKRLLELFARFDRVKLHKMPYKCLFVTLTYPSNMQDTVRGKRNLRAFIRRLERAYPGCWGVWRQERQQRGAIHFHLIIGGIGWVNITELQEAWEEVSGEQSNNSLDLKVIRSYDGVMYYVSKYVAKVEKEAVCPVGLSVCHNGTESDSEGRAWGCWNKPRMPLAYRVKTRVLVSLLTLIEWTTGVESDYAQWFNGFTVFSQAAPDFLGRLYEQISLHGALNQVALAYWVDRFAALFTKERAEQREWNLSSWHYRQYILELCERAQVGV